MFSLKINNVFLQLMVIGDFGVLLWMWNQQMAVEGDKAPESVITLLLSMEDTHVKEILP